MYKSTNCQLLKNNETMQYTDIHIHLQATHNVCIALICDTVYSLLSQLNYWRNTQVYISICKTPKIADVFFKLMFTC